MSEASAERAVSYVGEDDMLLLLRSSPFHSPPLELRIKSRVDLSSATEIVGSKGWVAVIIDSTAPVAEIDSTKSQCRNVVYFGSS